MKNPVNSNHTHPFWKVFLIYQVAVFGLVAALCWTGSVLTLQTFSSGLIVAGVLLLAVEIMGMFGSWSISRDFVFLYSHSVSARRLQQVVEQEVKEQRLRYGMNLEDALIGLFPILVGVILKLIAR